MKRFLNLALVTVAAVSLSACACVNANEQNTHASYETAGEMPTYSKDCKPGKQRSSGGGDAVFRSKQSK